MTVQSNVYDELAEFLASLAPEKVLAFKPSEKSSNGLVNCYYCSNPAISRWLKKWKWTTFLHSNASSGLLRPMP